MKAFDVKSGTYIDFNKENNKESPKFKVGGHLRISRYKHIFVKGYTLNQSEEVSVIKKDKHTVPQIYIINDIYDDKNVGTFHGKESQKQIQKEFRIEKVIQEKGAKLYVKSKGFDASFNSWIDKKMLLYKTSYYFAKRHERFDGDISVNLDLSNYIIKADLKEETTVDTSDLAKKNQTKLN